MSETVLVGLITGLAALIGAFIGAGPSVLQYRTRLRELSEQQSSRVHAQTIELIKAYGERIKLLEINRGVYSTHDPPLFLYWIFYRALKEIEGGKPDLPSEIKKLIARDFKLIGRNPKDYGLDISDEQEGDSPA